MTARSDTPHGDAITVAEVRKLLCERCRAGYPFYGDTFNQHIVPSYSGDTYLNCRATEKLRGVPLVQSETGARVVEAEAGKYPMNGDALLAILRGIKDDEGRGVDKARRRGATNAVDRCFWAVESWLRSIPSAGGTINLPCKEIVGRIELYFRRVRQLGGDTGECSAEACAQWILYQGGAGQDFADSLSVQSATGAIDAARWRFGVEHGFPTRHKRLYPEERVLGWQMPSQSPRQGARFYEADYPYYPTAEASIDAAMAKDSVNKTPADSKARDAT